MKNLQSYQFYVGSTGWDHPEWNGCFYPEDLPPEWRLAYYGNVFHCVYLSYAAWSSCDLQTLSGWVNDTLERFRFVLEASPSVATDADKVRLEVLAPRIGLVLGGLDPSAGSVVWLVGDPDLKKLASILQDYAASPSPVYLISRDHNLEAMKQVATLLEVMGI